MLFLFRSHDAHEPHVVGSWNGWKQDGTPLEKLPGTDLWVARLVVLARGRFEYKFVHGSGRWLSDDLNRKLSYNNSNSVLNMEGSGASHLERRRLQWQGVGPIDIVVYVPEGALDSGGRYPVVYMSDGQNIFDPSAPHGGWGADETMDDLIRTGKISKAMIVALAHPADRVGALTHTFEMDSKGERIGGNVSSYADFLVNTLKPSIDASYATRPDRKHTAILGSSLGGLASLWIAYHHHRVFGGVAGMSSTLSWGEDSGSRHRLIDATHNWKQRNLRIYLDSGGPGKSSPARDNWAVTREFRDSLLRGGYQLGKDFTYVWDRGAPHQENAWRLRLPAVLTFLLNPRSI